MANRVLQALTERQILALKEPGYHTDGQGLILFVKAPPKERPDKAGPKSWIFRYTFKGKRREMGLGPYPDIKLAEAREAAEANRKLLIDGNDPIEVRDLAAKAEEEQAQEKAPKLLFGPFARETMKAFIAEFKSKPHQRQWRKTFGALAGERPIKNLYAGALENIPVAEVETKDVIDVLTPIWSMSETATRVRGRIERILDAAKALGHRSGENPARWDGHLETLMSEPKKLVRGHHKRVDWPDMPAFMKGLRDLRPIKLGGMTKKGRFTLTKAETRSVSSLALEFVVYTVGRTSEILLAKKREIDWTKQVWTVPKERMKEGVEHQVPLCRRAIEILKEVWDLTPDKPDSYIFPGSSGDGHLSTNAMLQCIKGLNPDVTVHGIRSSFRDWAGDYTDFPREVAEAAIAHAVGSQSERSYRRGSALERRRRLMQEWQDYLEGKVDASTPAM